MSEIDIVEINSPHRVSQKEAPEKQLSVKNTRVGGVINVLSWFRGKYTFEVVWFGQLISSLGSGLTGFALGVWIYQQTGSSTLFAINLLVYALPNILLSPIAGAIADRSDRRLIMVLSDAGAGLSTLAIAILYMLGRLEIWQVYLATAFNASFGVFQWPAYSAAISQLVPKDKLGRAGGMVQIGSAISQLISPAAAGALMITGGLSSVILIDFATFLFAVSTLSMVKFPKLELVESKKPGLSSLWEDITYGWRYLIDRPGLLGLLIFFALVNFYGGFFNVLILPYLLDMASAETVGLATSIVSVGMIVGILVMSIWGGPRRRIQGAVGLLAIEGFFIILFGLRPSLLLIGFSAFWILFLEPIINGSSQVLWQTKVAQEVQGRVFSMRRIIAWSTVPVSYLVAGSLVDYVFTPWMSENGLLANSIGKILGIGPGRGAGLLFVLVGVLMIVTVIVAYTNPRIRLVEDELPDAIN